MNTLIRYITLFLAIPGLWSTTVTAQKIQFKVIHEETWKALEQVEIKSSAHGILYTDANGHFSLTYQNHDTLTLSKEHYHTIHYLIEAHNFDTSHTISLSLAALKKGETNTIPDISNLQKFDYHFVHDNPGHDSFLKIHAMESLPASQSRANQKEFKIGAVPLNHTQVQPVTGPGYYKLK